MFSAQTSQFNAIGSESQMLDALTAMLLLSNAGITDSPRLKILAAAAPNTSETICEQSNDEFLKVVTYGSVACVLRQ